MQADHLEDALRHIRSGGCVQPFLAGYATELVGKGHTLLTTCDYVRSGAHLGRWMGTRGITLDTLTGEIVAAFSRHRCACPGTKRLRRPPSRRYSARVRRFVEHLGQAGIIPPLGAPTPRPVPAPLVGFRSWMIHHRGVRQRTVNRYERLIKEMLTALGDEPDCYDAALVRTVLLEQVRQRSLAYAKDTVVALRAFLRFLGAEGRCRPCLARAVPRVPGWKLSALPRYLEADDVERLIASCDTSKPHGVRDRAVLLLLARLGLRAGDVAAMRLGDVDWKAGTARVCGKGRKEVLLPLPQEVGEALLDYLTQARPAAGTDRIFLCANAPIRPFATSASVSDIVRLALRRAGITDTPSKGAHLLRHSAATAMLRSGASLDAIGTVLRHESTDTTAHYAKVDLELLRQVAQPWPEGAPC